MFLAYIHLAATLVLHCLCRWLWGLCLDSICAFTFLVISVTIIFFACAIMYSKLSVYLFEPRDFLAALFSMGMSCHLRSLPRPRSYFSMCGIYWVWWWRLIYLKLKMMFVAKLLLCDLLLLMILTIFSCFITAVRWCKLLELLLLYVSSNCIYLWCTTNGWMRLLWEIEDDDTAEWVIHILPVWSSPFSRCLILGLYCS